MVSIQHRDFQVLNQYCQDASVVFRNTVEWVEVAELEVMQQVLL